MDKMLFPRSVPNTHGDSVVSADIVSEEGSLYKGTVQVNISGRSQRLKWEARYGGEGRWQVAGDGAKMRDNRVADKTIYPFTMDPVLNHGLKQVIGGLLNDHRRLRNGNGNGNGNGKVSLSNPPLPPAPAPNPLPAIVSPKPAAVVATEKAQAPVAKAAQEAKLTVQPAEAITPVVLNTAPAATVNTGSLLVKTDRLIPTQKEEGPGQPRVYFDPDELGELADSLKAVGQKMPIVVIKSRNPLYDYEIVDGERRWRAAKIIGLEDLFVTVTTAKDAREQHLNSVILNFNRADHTQVEISNALQYQITEGGKTVLELSAALGKSTGWCYMHLALQKIHPDLLKLLDPPTPEEDRMRMEVAHRLARAPKEKQLELYAEIAAIKNPRLQVLKAKEIMEPYTDKRLQKKAHPIEAVDVFLAFMDRLHGDLERTKTNPPSVILSLVMNRKTRLGEVRTILRQGQTELGIILTAIENVEASIR